MQNDSSFNMSTLLQVGVILLAVIFSWLPIFGLEFIQDDRDFLGYWDKKVISQANLFSLGSNNPPGHEGVYRPVRSMLYRKFSSTFIEIPALARLYSLFVHVGTSLCLYLLIREKTENPLLRILSVLIFALHPLQVEAIGFFAASMDMTGVFLGCLSLVFYRNYRSSRQDISRYGSLLLCFLALFTYELVIILPLVYVFLDLFYNDLPTTKEEVAKRYSGYFVLALVFFAFRLEFIDLDTRVGHWFPTASLFLLTWLKIIFEYVRYLLFPIGLNINHTLLGDVWAHTLVAINATRIASQEWLTLETLLSVLGIGFLMAWPLLLPKQLRGYGYLTSLWLLVSLLPVMQLVPSATLFQERYVYFGLWGVAFGLGVIGDRLIKVWTINTNRRFLGLLISIVLVFGLMTYQRLHDWKNDTTLWNSAYQQNKANPMILYKLASSYRDNGDFDIALLWYQNTLQLYPNFAEAHNNMGVIYELSGNISEAIDSYEAAIVAKPTLVDPFSNMGVIYYKQGDYENAIKWFSLALEVDPDFEPAQQYLQQAILVK